MKKEVKAVIYVTVGLAVTIMAACFGIFMYFSGTFLPYKYLLRKILYLVTFIVMITSIWFVKEGYTYLQRKIKRR